MEKLIRIFASREKALTNDHSKKNMMVKWQHSQSFVVSPDVLNARGRMQPAKQALMISICTWL